MRTDTNRFNYSDIIFIHRVIYFPLFKGGAVQQPKYKEIDTDFIPTAAPRGRGGGGRGRGRRVLHTNNLEDEASLYYVIKNNRLSLTVS